MVFPLWMFGRGSRSGSVVSLIVAVYSLKCPLIFLITCAVLTTKVQKGCVCMLLADNGTLGQRSACI